MSIEIDLDTLGKRLKHIRIVRGFSQAKLANKLQIAQGNISRYERDEGTPSGEALALMYAYLNVDLVWLLTGDGSPEVGWLSNANNGLDDSFVAVPRYAIKAGAGFGRIATNEGSSDTLAFKRKFLERRRIKPEDAAIIEVDGDSMMPRLSSGDLVLVNLAKTEIITGVASLIRIGDELLIKYPERLSNNVLRFSSENIRYTPIDIKLDEMEQNEIEILGTIEASSHEWYKVK